MLQLLGFSIEFVVLHVGNPAGEPIGGDYKARQRRREHFRFQLLFCQQLKLPMFTDAMPKAPPTTHVSENGVDFFAAHPPFLSGSSFSCHSVFAGQQQSRDAHSLRLNVAGPHVSFACSFPMRGARTRKRRERHQQRVREKQRKEREQKQRMIWNKSLSLGRALLHH